MLRIEKKYLLDEHNNKIAIQLDIETYNKIEQILEDFVLVQKIKENQPGERLSLSEAKKYYQTLKKSKRSENNNK